MSADKVCQKCGKRDGRFVNSYFKSHMMAYGHHFEPSATIPAQEQGQAFRKKEMFPCNGLHFEVWSYGRKILTKVLQTDADIIVDELNKMAQDFRAQGQAAQAARVKELEERWEKLKDEIWAIHNHEHAREESSDFKRVLKTMSELSSPQEPRDYTPEEALAEADKRWDGHGWIEINTEIDNTLTFIVGFGFEGSGDDYCGPSFRAAFSAADKSAVTEDKKP